MKYKVGDKVQVRDWDDMEREFGSNAFNQIKTALTKLAKEKGII